MQRVRLVKERVRLATGQVDTSRVDDMINEVEDNIITRMRKWKKPEITPKLVRDEREYKKTGKKQAKKVIRQEYYADPFAYNNDRHPAMVYRLRLLGTSYKEIAEIFMVSINTLQTWRTNFPDFNRAWLEGGPEADAVVSQALFRAATGWQHEEEKVVATKEGITKVPVTVRFKPDIAAAKFWLTNRQGKHWREKSEVKHTHTLPPVLQPVSVAPNQLLPPPTLEAGTFTKVEGVDDDLDLDNDDV